MPCIVVANNVDIVKFVKFSYGTNINSVPMLPATLPEPYWIEPGLLVTLAELDWFEL